MIKGSQLVGRVVIDMEAAERLGRIKEIIVQRDGERVAGFVVVHGETIVGFAVGEGVRDKLEKFFNPQRSRIHGYVRADADLQVGNELIVVPDDALIEGEPSTQEGDHKPATHQATETEARGWADHASAESTRPSI